MIDYLQYIEQLPVNADPEVFGMHDNANITCALAETYSGFDILMSLQPRYILVAILALEPSKFVTDRQLEVG